MNIDQGLLEMFLDTERKVGPDCDQEIWRLGVQILRFAGPRSWMIETFVRAASEQAGIPMDWHFAGGRAVVLCLPGDKGKAMKSLMDLMPTLEEAAKRAKARGDESAYEVQILEWNGERPPKPEDFPPNAIAWDPATGMYFFKEPTQR